MKKSLMIPAMVILLSQFVSAQNPEWIHYRTNNSGLLSNDIHSLAIELDSNGNNVVWMRAGASLTKFDGTTWTVYDSTVTGFIFFSNSIRFDSKKNIWLGTTTTGLLKFDRTNWTAFNTSNSQIPSNVFPFIDINENDKIFLGSPVWGKAYCEFDGVDKWTLFDSTQVPQYLNVWNVKHEPGTNNVWLANRGYVGAVLYNGNEFIIHSTTNSGISANSIFGLAIDKHHNKFFGPEGTFGINKLDSTNTQWTVYGYGIYGAYDMEFDKEGNLWWVAGSLYKATKEFKEVTVWNSSNSPLTSSAQKIAIDSNGNKWIGTTGGGLFVFNEGGIVNIDDNNSTMPENFTLYQNYPNPFNPTTNIKFSLPSTQYTILKIFDALGREVATLVNETLQAGSYNYQFSIDDYQLSSGVYFYTLRVEESYIETKKMVVLR